jgi:hypothetical protein
MSKLTTEQEQALIYESNLVLDLDLVWEAHPAQAMIRKALFKDGKKLVFGESGRKFGKTDIVVYCLYRFALMYPNSACYFIAPFQKQARELIWANNRLQNFLLPNIDPKTNLSHKGHTREEAFKIYAELKEKYGLKITDNDMRIRFANGSFIKLDGADNFEAYRGINPHFIAYDEFKDHHPKFHIGMDPNLATFDAPLFAIGTPCAGDEPNELGFNNLADYASKAEHGYYANFPSWSNPHISRSFLQRKKEELYAKGEEDIWLREYAAKRVKSGQRTIFPTLNKEAHTITNREINSLLSKRKDWNYYFGFDPASSSVFAGLFVAIHKYNRRILILDEIYETDKKKMSTFPIFTRAKEIIHSWNVLEDDVRFIYDNAAAWFANEVADKFDIGLEPCIKNIKGKEDMLSLIKDCLWVEDLILFNEKLLSPDRPNTGVWWEMINYRVDEKGRIPKQNDHGIDTLRYILNNDHYTVVPTKPPSNSLGESRYSTMDRDATSIGEKDPYEYMYKEYYVG